MGEAKRRKQLNLMSNKTQEKYKYSIIDSHPVLDELAKSLDYAYYKIVVFTEVETENQFGSVYRISINNQTGELFCNVSAMGLTKNITDQSLNDFFKWLDAHNLDQQATWRKIGREIGHICKEELENSQKVVVLLA